MAAYTLADCVTRPAIWPREDLTTARALLWQRVGHCNTSDANRLEARRMVGLIDAELAERKKSKNPF